MNNMMYKDTEDTIEVNCYLCHFLYLSVVTLEDSLPLFPFLLCLSKTAE